LSSDEASSLGRNSGAPGRSASGAGRPEVWPIDPDARLTRLSGRQHWHFHDGLPVAAEVAGVRIAAGDARIAHLGIRRDAGAHPYPAAFAHAPRTGEALGPPLPVPDPPILDIVPDSVAEMPLPAGLPALVRAGHPAALYLIQENLGLLEAWDGRAFVPLGRLPTALPGSPIAAGPEGIAYTTAETLISVPLPQLGTALAFDEAALPGLRFLGAPFWRGADLLAPAARDGRLVLCHGRAGSLRLDLRDLGPAGSGALFSGPWANRLGDAFWTGRGGVVVSRGGTDGPAVHPWPDGFVPNDAQAPWRDRADLHHQLGTRDGRYHLAALASDPALQRLDGPRLAAGEAAYWGAERFDVPWLAPAETLPLGPHAGALLVPLLAMPRDTVLLAVDIPGPRGGFLRGEALAAPLTGHVLHHAHGAGLRRLPVGLDVAAIGDARALVHDGALHLWSRSERRCYTLRLRAA
jgi:hypothetical protein